MAVVDFARVQADSAFIKKALAKFGLPLNINEAIAALAGTIRDHAHFQRLITETEPEMRQAYYDAVRPNLKFRAKPLDVYIADAQQMAEREQLPTLMPDGTLQAFKPASDVSTVEKSIAKHMAEKNLTLTCSKCTFFETFYCVGEETPLAVVMKARKAGWFHDSLKRSEMCPKCVGERVA